MMVNVSEIVPDPGVVNLRMWNLKARLVCRKRRQRPIIGNKHIIYYSVFIDIGEICQTLSRITFFTSITGNFACATGLPRKLNRLYSDCYC